MNKYKIKFKVDGNWITWYRDGDNMEDTLSQAKTEIKNQYGKLGSIAIAHDQGCGIYAI